MMLSDEPKDPTTSDEEDMESLGGTDSEASDSGESGDEVGIGKADSVPVVQTCYHKYISSEPMPNVAKHYQPVRIGNLHIGLPEPSDPMPNKAADWSVLHDSKNDEYVSALRVKEDADANVVRFYILTNQQAWQAQTRALFKPNKLSTVQVANLSLAVHAGTDFDKALLDHPELANFKVDGKIDHIFDTAWAKSVISKAEKKAKQRAANQQKRKAEEGDAKPAKKKKKAVHSKPTVEESEDEGSASPVKRAKDLSTPAKSPLKQQQQPALCTPKTKGTTPSKSPALPSKKAAMGRQLKLTAKKPAAEAKSSKNPKIFAEVAIHMRAIMNLLDIEE